MEIWSDWNAEIAIVENGEHTISEQEDAKTRSLVVSRRSARKKRECVRVKSERDLRAAMLVSSGSTEEVARIPASFVRVIVFCYEDGRRHEPSSGCCWFCRLGQRCDGILAVGGDLQRRATTSCGESILFMSELCRAVTQLARVSVTSLL